MTSDPRPGPALLRAELLLVATLCGLAFIGLALLVAGGPLGVDTSVADLLRPLRDGPSGTLIAGINLLGQATIWDPLVGALAVILWLRGHRFAAVVLVAGVISAEAGASVAKILVGRGRPPGIEAVDLITQASYPSGHMTRTVVTCGLLVAMVWLRPGWRAWRLPALLAAVAFAVLMGISRIAVGEHWFTDIVGAALCGGFALAVIGLAVLAVMQRQAANRANAGPTPRA